MKHQYSIATLIISVIFSAAAALAAPSYSTMVLNDNPVGYWRLSDTSGAAINEGSAGALLNGTYNNFPPGTRDASGLITNNPDTAANFVGQSTGGHDASATDITGSGLNSVAGGNPFANDWTIEGWFFRESITDWSGIFTNNGGPGQVSAPLITFNAGSNLIGINDAGVNAANISVDLGAGHLNDRIYVAITKTGGNLTGTATFNIYASIEGAALLTNSGANYWNLQTHDTFAIARHWYSNTEILDGTIDEVAIYNRALSAAEIQDHVTVGFAVPEPGSACLALLGALGLFASRRRRSRGNL